MIRNGASADFLSALVWLLITTALTSVVDAYYANVTLVSKGGDLSVVVFLPASLKPDEPAFYMGSRFEHGSMIGSIHLKNHYLNSRGETRTSVHTLFGTDTWRQPHNSDWPESGVGLAAEFGVGDDGAFCYYRCGWSGADDVTNGVLGYQEAKIGEPFLKIGVGELIKGSCPTCDSTTEDYKFNSPYRFSKMPDWVITQISDHSIAMEHEARLGDYGYKIVKDITLIDNTLTVTSTLTNLSQKPFSTAWYSHNFFNCDSKAVGPGYDLDLNLRGDQRPLYDEPGTWTWSTPLEDYAKVETKPHHVHIEMERALEPGIRIKSEFENDGSTNGAWTIRACDSVVESSIPEVELGTGISLYAYNLYVERGTFSPEPQILLNIDSGASKTWSQRLVVVPDDPGPQAASAPWFTFNLRDITSFSSADGVQYHVGFGHMMNFAAVLLSVALPALLVQQGIRRYRHLGYRAIPDSQ